MTYNNNSHYINNIFFMGSVDRNKTDGKGKRPLYFSSLFNISPWKAIALRLVLVVCLVGIYIVNIIGNVTNEIILHLTVLIVGIILGTCFCFLIISHAKKSIKDNVLRLHILNEKEKNQIGSILFISFLCMVLVIALICGFYGYSRKIIQSSVFDLVFTAFFCYLIERDIWLILFNKRKGKISLIENQ